MTRVRRWWELVKHGYIDFPAPPTISGGPWARREYPYHSHLWPSREEQLIRAFIEGAGYELDWVAEGDGGHLPTVRKKEPAE